MVIISVSSYSRELHLGGAIHRIPSLVNVLNISLVLQIRRLCNVSWTVLVVVVIIVRVATRVADVVSMLVVLIVLATSSKITLTTSIILTINK